MTTKPPPRCKAILLCDQTIRDAATGRRSMIGIFDHLAFDQFPTHGPTFRVYLQLTDGIGRYQISVEVHDLQEDVLIIRSVPGTIEFRDRLHKLHLFFTVPPLPLPHVGVYDVVVLADGQEIDRQIFLATIRSPNHGSQESEE